MVELFFFSGFLTTTSETLFRTVLEMQPRDTGEATGAGLSREDKVRGIIEDLLDKLPEEFNIPELMSRVSFPIESSCCIGRVGRLNST